MPEAGQEVLAFPDTQARQLAGVSMRRLRYWEQVGLVVPSIKRRLSEHSTVRLYSYQDLLALLVVSALRTERDMSLQKIRRIVKHLRSRGYQAPLRELKFATVGREIYFQHPDGTWEGDLRPDQVVIYEVILLDPLRLRIDRRPGVRPTTRAASKSAVACTPALRCSLAPGSGSPRSSGTCSRVTRPTPSCRHSPISKWKTSTKPDGSLPQWASAIPP